MKVHVHEMDGYLGRIARTRFTPDQVKHYEKIDCEGEVLVKHAFIEYDVAKGMHRPYLRLLGEVKSVHGKFPYDVSSATFGESRLCPKVDFRYRFTNKELAELCEKGLFDYGFEVPEKIVDNVLTLPMTCTCNALTVNSDVNVPLLFISVDNQYDMQTSYAESRYPIASYFEELTLDPNDDRHDTMDFDDDRDESLLFEAIELEVADEVFAEHKQSDAEIEEAAVLSSAFDKIADRVADKLLQEKEDIRNKHDAMLVKNHDDVFISKTDVPLDVEMTPPARSIILSEASEQLLDLDDPKSDQTLDLDDDPNFDPNEVWVFDPKVVREPIVNILQDVPVTIEEKVMIDDKKQADVVVKQQAVASTIEKNKDVKLKTPVDPRRLQADMEDTLIRPSSDDSQDYA